jgi:hypothetical protein
MIYHLLEFDCPLTNDAVQDSIGGIAHLALTGNLQTCIPEFSILFAIR